MEIYEKIRELRKKHLKLSMDSFGKRLGVSLDVINNIENNRLARPDQKLSLYKLICSQFNVNEDWLLNDTGPMFIEPDVFSLDDFAKCHGATELELEILKIYFELDPKIRNAAMEHFKTRLSAAFAAVPALSVPDSPEDLEKICPPIDMKDKESNVG